MKIVLPFLKNDEHELDSPNVSGGLERFSQLIYNDLNAEVIPFYYTREDRSKRLVTNKLIAFARYHDPDIIISNQDSNTIHYNLQEVLDTPIMWISHTASGGIFKIPQIESMKKFMSRGGTLCMVSEWQYSGMQEMSKRVSGTDLILNGGLINSAYCSGNEKVSDEITHDCVTIGRIDKEKDPFMLHRIAGTKKSLVLTSAYDLIPTQQKYLDDNKKWSEEKETIYNLPHSEVMKKMASSRVYFSTCSRETWGITALEAYSRGVPVVLIVNSSNKFKHASQDISPDPKFYATISKKNATEFDAAYKKLENIDRFELSERTKEKHSKENWIKTFENLIDKAIENNKAHKTPKNLFFQ